MKGLVHKIHNCRICEKHLEPNPVISVGRQSKILVVGQAPGKKVHETGIPWNDKSGENLRRWMDVDKQAFYNTASFGIIPMGFCFPGKGKSGDLPPRTECAPLWHDALLKHMKSIELIILVGQYAQQYYLKDKNRKTLTETVLNYKDYLPRYFVLPHPSPRNNIWRAKNEWFEKLVVPDLKKLVKHIL